MTDHLELVSAFAAGSAFDLKVEGEIRNVRSYSAIRGQRAAAVWATLLFLARLGVSRQSPMEYVA
jgi:hypothetical protein